MSEKIPCNITVALEDFSFSVGREEEEFVRKAAKLINDRMKFYQETQKSAVPKRLLALVALDYVMDNLKFDSKHTELQNTVMSKILDMDDLVDSILDA
jgi:cell division protein ZapA (FtsZ GTPase activity inhibitor)